MPPAGRGMSSSVSFMYAILLRSALLFHSFTSRPCTHTDPPNCTWPGPRPIPPPPSPDPSAPQIVSRISDWAVSEDALLDFAVRITVIEREGKDAEMSWNSYNTVYVERREYYGTIFCIRYAEVPCYLCDVERREDGTQSEEDCCIIECIPPSSLSTNRTVH